MKDFFNKLDELLHTNFSLHKKRVHKKNYRFVEIPGEKIPTFAVVALNFDKYGHLKKIYGKKGQVLVR